jgi:hypothetical protein
MTREAIRLQGRLAGSKRKRNEDDNVVPLTNGVASKSGDNSDSDEEESRVKALSKKEKLKSVFDRFSAPVNKKKKQFQAGTLANGAVAAPKPTIPLPTPNEPAPSKARSPGGTINGVPILFPPASPKSTPVPHRTPSPARSTSLSFGGSHTSRSISEAARRSLKRKAIFQQGRLEIIELEMPPTRAGTSAVTPSKHQVNKGKGKEKETEVDTGAHVPVIDLGTPKAKRRPQTPPPHEGDSVISPTTPHPPRIRQSLPNGSVVLSRPVLQLELISPMTQPNQESDSPKKKKRKKKRKKKLQLGAGGVDAEEVPKEAVATTVNFSDNEE